MALVDKNSGNIPEGDYLQLCNTIQELREHVKPPSFLDQTRPTWISEHDPERDGPPIYEPTHDILNGPIPDGQPRDWLDDELPSDPDTAAQRDREQDGDPSDYADSLIGHRPYPETATQREQEQLHQRWGIGGAGELPSDPDTAAQRDREQFHQHWREVHEEVAYPGLHEFLQQLDEEWSDPVEPGAYYPPPRQTMQEAVMMDVD